MKRIRLAYVTHGLSSNGIESLLVSIARRIDVERYDVTFVLALDPGVVPLHEPEILSLGMRVIHICDLDSLAKKRQYAVSLRRIFETERFDIVHANMDLLNGIVLRAAKQAGVPRRICHAHTTGSSYALEKSLSPTKLAQSLYHRTMRRWILQNATDLLGCSDAANAYMYGDRPAVVIHNGTELDKFSEAKAKADTAPDLRDAPVHLVTVGRISTPKNPLFLVEIVRELSALRQDFVLHWAGTGEMLPDVEAAVKANGLEPFVQLLGRRTDIAQILAGCSYFLLPSLFEGLGIVLIEAQAAGLTCLASDQVPESANVGGCRFLPLEAGAKGWARELCDMIDRKTVLAADPEKLRQFDIRNTIGELDRVYLK
ncbi:MAG: glycosyltransferase [Clostridia bacterium]|nr:glycosyltransferase [Clostridia bacterium]